MRRWFSIVSVLLLVMLSLPALACVTTASLSPSERDCCRAMHGDCGEMAKQGCCRVEVRSDLTQMTAERVAAPVHVWMAFAYLDSLAAALPAPAVQARQSAREGLPPPLDLAIARSTVLRI